METLIAQIAALLTTPPGTLGYHLLMTFTIAGSLSTSLFQAPASPNRARRRVIRGLAVLLGLQLALVLASGLVAPRSPFPQYIFPAADRAVSALNLFILIWMWAYPFYLPGEKTRAVLVFVLIAGALAVTLIAAPGLAGSPFNLSGLEQAWQAFMLGICLVGIWLAYRLKHPAWVLGTAMLGILALGHLIQWIFPLPAGDYPGLSRLADLAAYPFLFVLQGRPLATTQPNTRPNPFSQERRRHSTDPATLRAFFDLASTPTKPEPAVISRAVAHAMIADCCFLIAPYDPGGQVTFLGGYDLIQDISLPGMTLDATRLPSLSASLRLGKPLIENLEEGKPDPNREIGSAARFSHTGSLIFCPFLPSVGDPEGGILLISPYSNRGWTPEDQAYLETASAALARLILRDEGQQHSGLPVKTASDVDLDAIRAQQQELQESIDGLQEENAVLRSSLLAKERPIEPSKINEPDGQTLKRPAIEPDYLELVSSLVVQMRQSISAAAGYSELLSSLPSGDRVEAAVPDQLVHSIQRTRFLLEGVSSLLALSTSSGMRSSGLIDLPRQIDRAIENIRRPIQQKELAIQIDLPDDLPDFQADENALRQILIHLLQNAAVVTPPHTSISICVRLQAEEAISPVLVLQVTDGGGGVPAKDLPRVFSLSEGDRSRSIPGIAEDRVGLQVARVLVQALGGRIWIEPAEGKSTFSVLLPVSTPAIEPAIFTS